MQIRGWTPATALPQAPPFVRGVINLRGAVLPIIDFNARLGRGVTVPSARHVIIVTHIGARLVGLLVDAVSDILTVADETIQATPDLVNNPDAFKKFQDAQAQLTGALGRLLAISERYPDLKSNQNFLALQAQLEGTENRIAVARRDYIEAVRVYNTTLKTFPGLLWAATFFRSNKPMAEFAATDSAQTPPQVKFYPPREARHDRAARRCLLGAGRGRLLVGRPLALQRRRPGHRRGRPVAPPWSPGTAR